MASYGLKYYAEFRNQLGHDYTIEISQRSYSGSSKKIAYLAGCVLEIQGSQDDITAPIVKTQLRFTVIDAFDIADTSSVKYGGFSEFYTPDETLYKVAIGRTTGNSTTYFWTGFITPDSWQESLDYRTPLTFTARDNWGHLQDFQFDMTPNARGLVCIRDIITTAKTKANVLMLLLFNDGGSGSANHYEYDSVSPLDAYVNASLFKDMDWYSVLEQTLEGIGYTLRYIDGNAFCVAPLRNMPLFGGTTQKTPVAIEFYGGTREYDPAVKSIREEVNYETNDNYQPGTKLGLSFSGDTENYTFKYGNVEGTGKSDRVVNQGFGWETGYGFLDTTGYILTAKLRNQEGVDAGTKYPLLIANQKTPSTVQKYRINVYSTGITLHLVFAGPLERKAAAELGISKSYLKTLKVRVVYQYGTTLNYWTGEAWSASSYTLEYTPATEIQAQYQVDIPLEESDLGVGGNIIVQFVDIHFSGSDAPEYGIYARLSDISMTLNSSMLKSNTVTTINNDDYNVAVKRTPAFSALSIGVPIVTPGSYKNAIYYYDANDQYQAYGYTGHWHGASAGVPFPAMIHQQILAYRYGAAQVLSGHCGLESHGKINFNVPFTYKSHKFLLKGGTIDLFTGRFISATFHEFLYFTELWSDSTAPTTTNQDTEYENNGYGTSGGYSGGGASGGGGGGRYVLPIASANDLGGIKVGSNLSIDENGVLSATGGGGSTVSVSGLTTTGSQVGKITINGTTSTLKSGVAYGGTNATKHTVSLTVGSSAHTLLEEDFKTISLMSAPVIEFQRGFTKQSGQQAINPILYARHPAFGRITGAQYVLMVYSQRRGRNSRKGNRVGCFARKGWGAAQGKSSHSGLTWTTGSKLLNDIREFILHNFIAISGEAKPATMTYATLQAKSQYLKIGFSGLYNTAAADFKFKKNRRFGLAVRWENPAWTALGLTGTIDDTFTEYFENGVTTRRWIYSDVAEFKVHVGYSYTSDAGTTTGWVIGFERE